MGLEFIRKVAKSYRKGLDLQRIELATPTLFTRQPGCAPRTYVASLHPGKRLAAGEALGIRLDGGRVVALRGLDPVAELDAPPAALMDALEASHGEASGTVQEVYEVAETAEISVC